MIGSISRCTRRFAPVLAPALAIGSLACREEAISPSAPESGTALEMAQAAPLSFRQVSPGGIHTCGVTTDDRAYCWGFNGEGELGNGSDTGPDSCFDRPCSTRPVAVVGGLRFRQVSAGGGEHTCGVTNANRAFCWGRNHHGQLGNGAFRDRSRPVAVAGGLRWRLVSAGGDHTCGVTLDDRAYCWGRNDQGRLGDGTGIDRTAPTAVTGGLRFLQVSAGADHSCGVTTANRTYCWGNNFFGQLGEGRTVFESPTPLAIASGRRFRRVSTSRRFESAFTCAVTTDDRAFCWGNGRFGQIGDGKTFRRFTPRAVIGGHHFLEVVAGGDHTCGVTTANKAFCWGINSSGQLGDGITEILTAEPSPVADGRAVRQARAGGSHSCGVTLNNRAFCWGSNFNGALGDGTTTDRSTPVLVAPPAP
jgi:alpha-tubulin suppressor-like RCC1 family protein